MLSNEFYKRLSYLFGLYTLLVLFGLAIFMANVEIKDFDLWLHIKMGQFIVQNGYVPSVDVLSATMAGKSWVNHEWLFQVIVYSVFHKWARRRHGGVCCTSWHRLPGFAAGSSRSTRCLRS